jgi:hypothetical protein
MLKQQRPERYVSLQGYFYVGKENYPDLDRFILDREKFKLSARKFRLEELRIVDLKRGVGSFFKLTEVVGVVHLKGSLVPFFVNIEIAEKLSSLISTQDLTMEVM